MSCLVMKLNIVNIAWVETETGSSALNPTERTMHAMSRAFKKASTCRVETNTNIEKELIRKKSCKYLIASNPCPIIIEACTQ